jgi:ABC-type nitrate/sulfonate/bicarbonate transport system substrate-binding protein
MNKILCTLPLLIVSWTMPFSVSAAPDVVVGYANISARVSPLWIAQEKGFFAKYGVSVQPVYMPGSPVMIASLSTGQIQLANSGGTALDAAAESRRGGVKNGKFDRWKADEGTRRKRLHQPALRHLRS